MKTIAILIQTADDKKDLVRLANELGTACDFYLSGNKMLDSWRTPFPMIVDYELITAIRKLDQ